jgi:hypothetical protein
VEYKYRVAVRVAGLMIRSLTLGTSTTTSVAKEDAYGAVLAVLVGCESKAVTEAQPVLYRNAAQAVNHRALNVSENSSECCNGSA